MERGAVIVTGASSGIGEATAVHLRSLGFDVIAAVRKDEDAKRLEGDGFRPLILEVTDSESIERARAELREEPLSGLVNNAGIGIGGPLEFFPIEELRRVIEVNFIGQIAVTQAFLPALRRSRGRIVNVSSVGGRVALPLAGPYASSKFALEAASDSLRRELGRHGVDVIVVEPGGVKTPIWEKGGARADELQAAMPAEADQLYGELVGGRVALPLAGPYASSKFALEAASDSLRRELGRHGIDVIVVEPGGVKTPIWEKGGAKADELQAAMPAEADRLYGELVRALRAETEKIADETGMPPAAVAEVIGEALTAKRPRTRYPVGRDAKVRSRLARLLPDRIFDRLIDRTLSG